MNLLKEPLLHFLCAGGLLFAAYLWLNPQPVDSSETSAHTVRVTAGEVEWLERTWTRQWQRPPSEDELKGLLAGYLKEKLLAREARELGLDDNDTVVRRRLAQKVEFVVQDTAQAVAPGEEELRRVYAEHRERFVEPARISFTHVYFDRARRGAETEARAVLARLSLADGPPAGADLGDRLLVPQDFDHADEQAITSQFGPEFARRLLALDTRAWAGPIESAYGLHLVRISDRQPERLRDFTDAKDDVTALWRQQNEARWRERYIAALLKKYDLVVDESIEPLLGPLVPARAQVR